MNERVIIPKEAVLLYCLKNLPIEYEIVQEENASWSSWTLTGLITYGEGSTREECLNDLVSGLQDIASSYFADFEDWVRHNPGEFIYALKVMNSSTEELKSCLRQMN